MVAELGLNMGLGLGVAPTAPTAILCQAIARHVCVTATYNNKALILAPHIVFTKHDDQFLGAVTIEQDGKKSKVSKLGTFKLTGLTAIASTTTQFEVYRSFNTADPQYADNIVCALGEASRPGSAK